MTQTAHTPPRPSPLPHVSHSSSTPPAPAQSPHVTGDTSTAKSNEVATDAPPRGPVIQLNAFQSLMRRWSKLHPYNAGQVVRVSGAPDPARWKRAAEAVIGELGLGRPHFSAGESAVQFAPAAEIAVEQAVADKDLQKFFNEELNRPFSAGDLPIRFCVLAAPPLAGAEGPSIEPTHYLAAVYDHWIADSRAMRELMHRMFERYQRPDAPGRLPPLTLAAPAFRTLYRKYGGPWKRATATRESIKNLWRHRRGYRLNLVDPLDFTTRFLYRELPEGLIQRLHKFSKNRGASVNDLFIAIIAQSLGVFTAPDRLGRARKPLHFNRTQVGIGTIVDIRDSACQPLDNVFNLYLSSYTVMLDEPEQHTPDELTRIVNGETSWIKRTHRAVRSCWAMLTVRFWYGVYDSPRFQASLLHKTVPVVAGISNVNMTRSWADPQSDAPASATDNSGTKDANSAPLPRVLDYLRISPAGPLIPLVFTLTTIGGRLSLCVTFRTTSFREDKARELVDDFIRRLQAVDAA